MMYLPEKFRLMLFIGTWVEGGHASIEIKLSKNQALEFWKFWSGPAFSMIKA